MIELIRWFSHIDPKKFCYSCVVFFEGVAIHMGLITGFDLKRVAEKYNIVGSNVDGMVHCFWTIIAGLGLNVLLDIYRAYFKDKFHNWINKFKKRRKS